MCSIPIVLAPGDGIGKEISVSMTKVVNAALNKHSKKSIMWLERDLHNIDEALLKEIREVKNAIKGPTTTPVGKGRRSINVLLRQSLDLYACVRPVMYFEGVPSPLKHPENVNITVFRENTEDVYSGIEWESGSLECTRLLNFLQNELGVKSIRFPETTSLGIKNMSREGSKRIIRSAIKYAYKNSLKTVTMIHKGNIMKFTEGEFRNIGYEIGASEFGGKLDEKGVMHLDGDIVLNDCICDNFFQQAILSPEKFSVVVAPNLNGDYISDALAAEVGGIGYAPGSNINYEDNIAVYEATHGSAPDIAGKNIANPMSMILSATMMLKNIGEKKSAEAIENSIKNAVRNGFVTNDFYTLKIKDGEKATLLNTTEFTDYIIKGL